MKLAVAAVIATLIALPVAAQESSRQTAPESWQPPADLDPASQWARVAIKIDKRGRPLDCRIVASNVRSKDLRFRMCLGIMKGWKTDPVLENGEPVETTLMETMIIPSRQAREAWSKQQKAEKAKTQ